MSGRPDGPRRARRRGHRSDVRPPGGHVHRPRCRAGTRSSGHPASRRSRLRAGHPRAGHRPRRPARRPRSGAVRAPGRRAPSHRASRRAVALPDRPRGQIGRRGARGGRHRPMDPMTSGVLLDMPKGQGSVGSPALVTVRCSRLVCGVCGVGVVGCSGGVLLSHGLSAAVPSALEGLASGFGMGPGVSPPLWPPEHRATPTTCTHTCCPPWGWVWSLGYAQWTRAVFLRCWCCAWGLDGVWGKSSAY